jgi:hypothetical protein
MKRFQHMHRILFRLLFLGATMLAVMVTALSLLGSLNDRWWMSELLSQPRPQYALVLMLCLPILVVRFQRAGWLTLIPLLQHTVVRKQQAAFGNQARTIGE